MHIVDAIIHKVAKQKDTRGPSQYQHHPSHRVAYP